MSNAKSSTDATAPEREALRLSATEAYLEADAAMWLATGDILVDERNPASRLARELDRKIAPDEYRDWLTTPQEALDGRTPGEALHEDEPAPVLELLRAMADRDDLVAHRPGGNDR